MGAGALGASQLGTAVALSADGNTAIVGGFNDNDSAGAAWVFTRSGGVWTQQGSKLAGAGAVGIPQQGCAVALSSDGNTAIVGGGLDNNLTGAAWVFTRSGGIWTQQGSKLVGSGGTVPSYQGGAVALSSDGNTAIVGGPEDNNKKGAVWVFTRSGGVWTQQGGKLLGIGGAYASQGWAVALSADGTTTIIGGPGDNLGGAAWAFARPGAVWTQEGSKLVGAGAVNTWILPGFGRSVALSADGNTALVGGSGDNGGMGAAWVFTRGCHAAAPFLSQLGDPAASTPLPNQWGTLPYDNLAGETIAERGSALTSLAMALNYAGQSWDPGTLDSLLQAAGGFTPAPADSVIWQMATAATNSVYAGSSLAFDDLGAFVNSNLQFTTAIGTVEQAICAASPLPVIVGVKSPSTGKFPGHYVVVTGEIVNPDDGTKAFLINDPYYQTTIIGSDHVTGNSGYAAANGQPEFWTRGAVHNAASLTSLSATVDAVVDLMVTDPNGLQSGYVPGNSTPSQHILNSGAAVDEIDDTVTGAAGSPVQTVLIESPAAGTFQISVTGTATGPYSLEVVAEASDGSIQSFSALGTAAFGVTTTYGVAYTGAAGGARIATINGSPVSACDIDYRGTTDISDVQSSINQALGVASAANDLNGDGVVNVVDVQVVIGAALGLPCW